jgi:leucyl aminopeptidase
MQARVCGFWTGQHPDPSLFPLSAAAVERPEWEGKAGDICEDFEGSSVRVITLCLGDPTAHPTLAFRRAIAAACRRIEKVKAAEVALELPADATDSLFQAAGETVGMLSWSGGIYKTSPQSDFPVWTCPGEGGEAFSKGLGLAHASNRARTLAFTSPAVAVPSFMAEAAKDLAESCGLAWSCIAGEDLERERLNGIAVVGRASVNPPCLIRLEWNPQNSTEKPIVLVGKTVTYDTGGLSIKSKTSMPGMKGDKAGGCAVLGAMEAIATVYKPNRRIVALLPAAENSISGSAYRPDDVITFRNGLTAEITNTDAEGRLVLADALCWACEVENAEVIVDAATLTGGVVTALGDVMAGLFANDDQLAQSLIQTGAGCAERLWRLPLDEEYDDYMKSDVADMVNSNLNGKAHPVQGAAFLSRFVTPGTLWAHLDIAGVAEKGSEGGIYRVGPTGFGVRLLAAWASGFSR